MPGILFEGFFTQIAQITQIIQKEVSHRLHRLHRFSFRNEDLRIGFSERGF